MLPLVVFFTYFFLVRYNTIWFDEYENFPYFLAHFLDASSASERLQALLRPNNEHRLLYARLVAYGQYLFTGGLNFNALMLWGNLSLVVILFLFYRILRQRGLPLVYLLPVPLFLFSAQNYLLTFTALYTLQYLAIIMLALLTFYVLAKVSGLSFAVALVLGVFSTFSMGNGMMLWPAGAAMLVYQRAWGRLLLWIVTGAVAIAGYFYGYPVQQSNAEAFVFIRAHPLQIVKGVFAFAGSLLDVIPAWPLKQRILLPIAGGALVVGFLLTWAVRLLLTTLKPRQPVFAHDGFLLGSALFLIANVFLIAFFRTRFGFEMVLWSSYRTYILVLWAVAYLILIVAASDTWRVRLLPLCWLLAAGVSLVSYLTYVPEAVARRHFLRGQTFNQRYSQIGLGGSRNSQMADQLEALTDEMKKRGWFELMKPALISGEEQLLKPARPAAGTPQLLIQTQGEYVVVNDTLQSYKFGLNNWPYLVFQSDQHTYVMAALLPGSGGRNPFQHQTRFQANMPTGMIQAGTYRVGIYQVATDQARLAFTNQVVRVD